MMMDHPATSFKCKGTVSDFGCHSTEDLTFAATMKGVVHWVSVGADGAARERAVLEPDVLDDAGSCRNVAVCEAAGCIAVSFADKRVGLFDAVLPKVVRTLRDAHADGISALASVSEHLLASGDEAGAIKLWDLRQAGGAAASLPSSSSSSAAVAAGQPVAQNSDANADYIAKLHPYTVGGQRALLSCSGDGVLGVFDLRKLKVLGVSDDTEEELTCIAVAKRGKKVLVGTESGTLAIFSAGRWGDMSDRFPGHPESVSSLLALDDDTVISGGGDGIVRVLSIQPNRFHGAICKHNGFSVNGLGFTRGRRHLVSSSHDRLLRFWDASLLTDDDGGSAKSGDSGGGAGKATSGGSGGGKATATCGGASVGGGGASATADRGEGDGDDDDNDVDDDSDSDNGDDGDDDDDEGLGEGNGDSDLQDDDDDDDDDSDSDEEASAAAEADASISSAVVAKASTATEGASGGGGGGAKGASSGGADSDDSDDSSSDDDNDAAPRAPKRKLKDFAEARKKTARSDKVKDFFSGL